MIDLTTVSHNPCLEELTNLLCNKTQNTDKGFFRIEVAYFLCKIASCMRAYINTKDRGNVPINCYAIALANSGQGKGYSMGIMENEVISGFKKVFCEETFNEIADRNLTKRAIDRASKAVIQNQDIELDKLKAAYERTGSYIFTFDSGTTPAIKQLRTKLLLSGIGSINLQIDECFTPDMEVLTKSGFKLFKDLTNKDLVAQYDLKDRNISFAKPLKYISKDYDGDIYNLVAKTSFDFSVTKHHEVLVENTAGNLVKKYPEDLKTGDSIILYPEGYTSGIYNKISNELKLALAIQADGSIRKYKSVEFGLSKQRKIDELFKICSALGISPIEEKSSRPNMRYFYLKTKELRDANIILSKDLRDILPPINTISTNFAREVLDEIIKWDGSINKELPNNYRFTNKYYHNVDLVQQYVFIAGYRSKIISNNKKGYEGGYYVRWNTVLRAKHALNYLNTPSKKLRTKEHYHGKVYCVTMPKGTLVVRRNGKICINGNCGSNLLSNTEILNTFLELYDQGMLKPKLIKNTTESIRDDDIDGKTPANLMMFGTPVKLLDGSATEDAFYSFLETGYARRCLFGLGVDNKNKAYYSQTPAQIYQNLIQSQNQYVIDKWNTHFTSLAQPSLYNWEITLEDDVAIKLLEYRIDCEKRADELNEYAEIQKAELSHRYFKALKLAGAFAYIDNATILKEEYLNQAIKLVEESGQHFTTILNREKSYMKLAKYLANVEDEVTHADLTEALPFYKTSSTQRNEMMSMAMAWGYKNKIIIKKSFADGIEFFKGESLKKTDLDKMIISYSDHYAYNYLNDYGPWNNMEVVFSSANTHWCNHHFTDGNRCTEKALYPFNMVVVDVDSGISLTSAQELLHEYNYIMYTTKRNTADNNRFRIIIPLEYVLELDNEDYKEFMNNVLKWLPFQSDEAANQIAKKWESYDKTTIVRNDGKLLDPFPFIPKTSRNEQYLKAYQKIESMDNLTRWFASRMQVGDRNNQMLKYALCLKDSGLPYEEVESRVLAFNKQLKNPLTENEIRNSILVTTAKSYV